MQLPNFQQQQLLSILKWIETKTLSYKQIYIQYFSKVIKLPSHLSSLFCISDESIQTIIDNFKVIIEFPLPGYYPPC